MTTQEKTIYTTPLLTLFSTDKGDLKLRIEDTELCDIVEDILIEQFDIEDFYHTTEQHDSVHVYTLYFADIVDKEKVIEAIKSINQNEIERIFRINNPK
jgi:hypothetical protein